MEDKGEKSSSSSFEDLSNLNEEDLKATTEPSGTEDKDTIDILGNKQLIKRVIVKGISPDGRPERSDICKINLEGRLESGELVEKLENFTVQLGDYEVRT